MAQPQSQARSRAFSPPQHTPSPAATATFPLPPNKRVRTDGSPSQPGSPYTGSPYDASLSAANTPPANVISPGSLSLPTQGLIMNSSATQMNGHTTIGLTLPDARASQTPPIQTPVRTPQPAYTPQTPSTAATIAPVTNGVGPPGQAQSPAVMGPPQRPADRPAKDYEYDVTDSLAGTGIDLRAEEQYMSDLYSNHFDSNTEARTGFPQYQPGSKSTLHGAGSANQPAEPVLEPNQDRFAAQAAEQAWVESSLRLAAQRTQEIRSPFLLVALLHQRAEKIAKEHHIGLNLDMKDTSSTMGKMRLASDFPSPHVSVKTVSGPDSTMVSTTGSFIPHDAYLADQLALISIATKHRLRELVEDAHVLATHRQKTSHGDVPERWEPAAAPMNKEPLEVIDAAEKGLTEVGGAASPAPNAVKRMFRNFLGTFGPCWSFCLQKSGSSQAAELPDGAAPAKMPKIASHVTITMREMARRERELEEKRLRKRQHRRDGAAESTSTPSRSGSVAPGTPGSVAPEPEKAMTKKEMKKSQALKAAEASSHANQNLTSSMFAGLGGKGSLFGKKKNGKTYDWMNVGRNASGATTPTRGAAGGGKAMGGALGTSGEGHSALTSEARNRLGSWREDKEKGKAIQLRDWVVVLERDGREPHALQHAYIHLDTSAPR